MGYVEENLVPGEQVLYKAKLHWGMFIGPVIILGMGLFFLLLSFLPLITSSSNSDYDPIYSTLGCIICCVGPFFLYGVIYLLSMILSFLTTEFALTDRRIIAKTGIIQRRSLEILIGKVESIGVSQPVIGRLLNYGTIVVCGTGGTKQSFHNIFDPMGLRQRINNQIAKTQ
jgi:uncharacterized membrane protein YdbT with pleckstrin-like domain